MTLSTLFATLLYLAGIAAVIAGLRSLFSRSPHLELRPPTDLRRAARVARIDDFRKRRIEDHEPVPMWKPPDDPGPTAA